MTGETPNPGDPEGLLDLIADVLHGTAGAAGVARLEGRLRADPEARRAYLRHALLHAELSLTDDALIARAARAGRADADAGARAARPARWRRPGRALALASALAASAFLAVGAYQRSRRLAPLTAPAVAPVTTRADPSIAHYDDRDLPLRLVATVEGDRPDRPARGSADPTPERSVSSTTLQLDRGEARLSFAGGAVVDLEGPAVFGLESKDVGVLYSGTATARMGRPGSGFALQTPGVRIVDRGEKSRARATVDRDGSTEVRVLEGRVEAQVLVRLPRFSWSFDGPSPPSIGQPDGESLRRGPAVRQVAGLIGPGALEFDDRPGAFAEVAGGLGEDVGSGDFAVSRGVTIEALIVPRWTGRKGDYDEIFRKDDGKYRMLLSFQNDAHTYDVPDVAPGPCLSFGLHLSGLGYSELDMPLDGRDGRPTLAELEDGRPHHVVATYDSFSGRKAIFLDGRARFEHNFPIGTLILSGGPDPACIGNHDGSEPFRGVIDELAFYEFALKDREVEAHHDNVLRGRRYFGDAPSAPKSGRWDAVATIAAGQVLRFDRETGRPRVVASVARPPPRPDAAAGPSGLAE